MKLQSFYIHIEADSNDNVTRHLYAHFTYHKRSKSRNKRKELYGAVLVVLLKYTYGLDSTHKGNIDKHGKSGEQHDNSL